MPLDLSGHPALTKRLAFSIQAPETSQRVAWRLAGGAAAAAAAFAAAAFATFAAFAACAAAWACDTDSVITRTSHCASL